MKKILTGLMVMSAFFCMSGCSSNKSVEEAPELQEAEITEEIQIQEDSAASYDDYAGYAK